MQREPGKTEILKATLQFLSKFCNLQCEPPLRSAVPYKDNTLPPWTIELNLLEMDRQAVTDAMATLQKYGNKIPCFFTDEHDQPISIELRLNLVMPRTFDTKDQVSYIVHPPRLSQMTSKQHEQLLSDIRDRQDPRCSPPFPQQWHVTRGTTPVMSAESGMLINVLNDNVILTIRTELLQQFNSTIKSALPPYALMYLTRPDGSQVPIHVEINLTKTEDFGPGLCLRTRTTHNEDSASHLIDFVPRSHCPTCNTKAKSFTCNCCGDEVGKNSKDKNEFLSAKNNHDCYISFLKDVLKDYKRPQDIPAPILETTKETSNTRASIAKLSGHSELQKAQELARERTMQASQARQSQKFDWTKRSDTSQDVNNNTKKRPAPQSLRDHMRNKRNA